MALNILSKKIENPNEIFKNIALVALKAKLSFSFTEWAIYNNRIEINIQKCTSRYIEESILIDIIPVEEQIENIHLLNYVYDNSEWYCITGSSDFFPEICYYFSLWYLRLNPTHIICIYDKYLSINDIEKIETNTGFHNNWFSLV